MGMLGHCDHDCVASAEAVGKLPSSGLVDKLPWGDFECRNFEDSSSVVSL